MDDKSFLEKVAQNALSDKEFIDYFPHKPDPSQNPRVFQSGEGGLLLKVPRAVLKGKSSIEWYSLNRSYSKSVDEARERFELLSEKRLLEEAKVNEELFALKFPVPRPHGIHYLSSNLFPAKELLETIGKEKIPAFLREFIPGIRADRAPRNLYDFEARERRGAIIEKIWKFYRPGDATERNCIINDNGEIFLIDFEEGWEKLEKAQP